MWDAVRRGLEHIPRSHANEAAAHVVDAIGLAAFILVRRSERRSSFVDGDGCRMVVRIGGGVRAETCIVGPVVSIAFIEASGGGTKLSLHPTVYLPPAISQCSLFRRQT